QGRRLRRRSSPRKPSARWSRKPRPRPRRPTPKRPRRPTRPPKMPRTRPKGPARISEDVRLRLDIAYDGTGFAGWAAQTGQRTVAGILDEALTTVFRAPVRLRAAGRTDAGVHATGQVAHVDVPPAALPNAYPRTPRAGEAEFAPLLRRLGRFLPTDVRVVDITRAPAGFDARFSALRRHYVYRLSTATWGVQPQQARYVTAWPRPLDVDAMATASRDLVGLHDFAAFGRHRENATCSDWSGRATVTRSPRRSAPTRSAGRWCAHWSERCWPSANTGVRFPGAANCFPPRRDPATTPPP